jgi:hypothetical protein
MWAVTPKRNGTESLQLYQSYGDVGMQELDVAETLFNYAQIGLMQVFGENDNFFEDSSDPNSSYHVGPFDSETATASLDAPEPASVSFLSLGGLRLVRRPAR